MASLLPILAMEMLDDEDHPRKSLEEDFLPFVAVPGLVSAL